MRKALLSFLFICLLNAAAGGHQAQAQPPCFVDATINTFGTVCEDGNPLVDLSELLFVNGTTTAGGSWSIVDASDLGFGGSAFVINNTLFYLIDPTTSPVTGPPYVYNILLQYIVTDPTQPAPCNVLVSDVATVSIFGAIETGFDLPDSWCQSYGTLYVPGYTVAGGGEWDITFINNLNPGLEPFTVSSVLSYVSNGALDLNALAGLADFGLNPGADSAIIVINYQPAQGGCSTPKSEVFVLYEDVNPAWDAPQNVCMADLPLALNPLITGTTGGVFSGTGVVVNNNGTPNPSDDTYTFAPPVPGLYSVTYTVGFGVCAESATFDIVVYPVLDAAFNAPLVVCESPSGTIDLSALFTANMPTNGAWTITGSNLSNVPAISGNTLFYTIAPADVSPYIIDISYDLLALDALPEGTPCNPADIIGQVVINGASEIGFDLPSTRCVADGPVDLQQYTAGAGGVWSLATNPEVSIGATYTPQNGDGLVGILYTPGPGGCGMPHVEYIEFLDDVDPFWLNPVVLCQADLPYQLEFATPGGTWSGPGVNPITGQFGIDPQVYVIDFGSGMVVETQPGNPNRIYAYQEDGMNISALGGGSPTNFFEFMQIGYQTDIVLTNGTSSGVRFDRGGAIFELLYVQLDAQPLSGGFVVTGYDAADNAVGTVVVPDNAPGGSAIVMPPAFYGIAYFTVVNQLPSIRTRIEEIAFNDLTTIVAPGYYTVTYTVGEQPCQESETHVIQVAPTRSADIRDMTVCQSPSGTVDLTSMIQPGITTPGGIFTVVGSNLAIPPTISNNTLSYQISFADVPPYTINIQYSLDPILNVFNPGLCNPAPDIAILTITDVTETGFDLPDSWCVANGAIYLPNFTTLGGGTYSLLDNPLTPFNESEIPLTGDVFIPYNGAGLMGITYTPIPNGCGSPSTEYIQILDDWNVEIAPAGPFCPGDAPVNLSVNVVTPIPYPQGVVQTYLPGATVVIPAGTTVQVYCGDPTDVCFVPITFLVGGITINYNNGTTIPFPAGATVSFPDGATVTYLVSPVQTQFTTVSSGTSGQLNSSDPVASRPSGTGFVCDNVAGNYRYDTFTFQVSAPGNYVFIGNFGAGDGYAYVTQVPYTPGDCGSGVFVAKDDNSGPGLNPQFGTGSGNSGPTLFLQPGITYQLITTSVAPNATLNYSWVFSGPGNVLTQTVPVGEWSGPGIVNEDTGLFSPIVAGLGTHVITYTTYNGSCINEESITIFVGDDTPPAFTFCPDDIQTTTVSCSAFVNVPNPTATDNCPGILSIGFVATHPVYGTITSGTITNANQASGIYPAGFTTIVWTVTDVAGNTATCDTEIRVIDSANPVIFCQQALSITGYTDVNSCGTFMELATPVAYDNCGLDQLSYVAVHITDANGAPIDTDPNTPGNQPDTIYTNSMPALINGGSNTTPIANNVYPGGVTVVTWTVTDLSARTATCSVTVNVIDNVAPILINCPANITENTYPGLCAAIVTWVPPMAIDNCSANVDPALIGALNFAHQALEEAEDVLDAATNAATAADNALAQAQAICGNVPTIACQTLINIATADSVATHQVLAIVSVIYQNALNAYFAAQQALETAAAAATITITSTHQPGDIFQLGNTTVVYTATDGAGNTSTCSFVVTVIDEELPTLTCPPNVTANSIPTHCYGNAFVGFPTNLQDNCGINQLPTNSIDFGFNASGNYPVGTTTVVWSIQDINGNVGTCSMTVTIVDVEPPTITFCPEDTALPLPFSQFYDYYTVTAPGVCEANITIAPLQAWDNCGIASIVNNFTGTDNASGIYPQGQTIVTWTVTDIWNNTSTCATVVFVHDNQAPTITCPVPVAVCTADCTNNATGQYVEPPLPTFTDNCSISVVANSFTNIAGATALFPNGFIFSGNGTYPIGTTTIVWTVQDVGGNTNSCATSVTVTKCCQAEAGTLTLSGAQCPTDQLVATATGFTTTPTAGCANTADTYSQWYLVVDNATGLIAALNTTGVFDALGANGLPSGNYTVYAYNSGANNPPSVTPDIGVAIADIMNDVVGCFDLSNAVGVFIPDAFPDEPLIGSIYQGTGIVPTFFNVVQIQVSGGTQPYSYNWTGLVGYVQHSVNQNPNGGVLITVVYADNAQWNLQVFDANGCTETSLQFDNLPDTANPSVLLDIYDYTISSTTANSLIPNGSITIYVEGGTPCGTGTDQYQYNWSGPSNWTNPFGGPVSGSNVFNLTGLVAGWYIVEVTDCSGQSTTGWYWVPKQVRGRGKLADNQLLTAYPNPFTQQTTIEFTVTQTEAATLSVIAMDGKEVATLFKGEAAADELYSVTFDADNLPAGMYMVQLNTASGTTERYKIMLNK
ncbi:MAG TPA: HYR domain-containing protein [Chitinophagales bacterium]|nr:HYR domain-containing protein [Chitinophagales bacterium]HRK27876.1 HYR domain-containing protein [Chitinophagales bacterium]